MSVLLETSLGDIVIDLLWEKAPFACKNFIKLCKVKYYNGALFYDVQKDYLTRIMHEKKEPTSLNHMLYGEQAKYFEDQIDPEAKHNRIGTVSTANVGPNMNNSNFFMTLSDDNIQSLNGKHTIFGIIAEGADILRQINEVYVDERNRPYQNIRILHTPVLDDPFDDPAELEIPENSPEINYEETDRLDINDKIDTIEGHGRTEDEIIEETKKHEAKTKAIVLEMLNDLPDAEIKPPDNVLFVCKLNPVTQEDDLETIFSQFGPIKSCEVIRDWKTGASLQYCFIEFETQAACEEAYFKMENALIDERRIHVDFSQSVAKYWYKYKAGQPMAFNGKGGKDGGKEGGGHRGPRLELKRQQREDRGSYGIVIDEDEAHRESRRHKNQENKRENKPREENRGGERENRPREENRGENRPREDNRRRDDNRDNRDRERGNRDNRPRENFMETERERERRKSRSRSGERRREKERERDTKEARDTKGRRDRSRSRSPRRDKRDSGRDKERERERERDRTREKRRDDSREKRHSEKDSRRKDDHRSSRKEREEKKRKQSSSSSRSSSSSSSSSGSRSSS